MYANANRVLVIQMWAFQTTAVFTPYYCLWSSTPKGEKKAKEEQQWHSQTPASTTKKHGEISMTEKTSPSHINTQHELQP